MTKKLDQEPSESKVNTKHIDAIGGQEKQDDNDKLASDESYDKHLSETTNQKELFRKCGK